MTDFNHVIERLKTNRLWRFPGGVHPEDNKQLSNQVAIERPPLADVLYIPLKQHIGDQGHCIVSEGDHVLKGQALTTTYHPYAVPVHAPTSGTISHIGEHVSAHPSGLTEASITLVPDGLDEWCQLQPHADYMSMDKLKLIEILCDAGISGMGGAGFPTHIKANSRKTIEFLIINGIECEPYITSDDRLMREYAWQIRQGMDILQHIIQPKAVVVAIEDNKPEAIEAMQIACNQKPDCHIVSVPTVYPAGGEKQLIQVLTGREVPGDGLPEDIGTVMFNVGTCFAVADAVCNGKPLIERVVTLTGGGIKQPKNVWAMLGTPVSHLVEYAGLLAPQEEESTIIMGGPMMGFTVGNPLMPVVKITNCLLVPEPNELRQGDNERPCIRCSACADACPASLLPQQLYWHAKAKEYDKAQSYNLFDCIECGACAYVCPSDIPLVQYYRQAKSAIRNERDEKNKAEKAKARFEARKARLDAEKQEREERHRKAAEARLAAAKAKTASADNTASQVEQKSKSAAAAAAIARAKAKKAQQQADVATHTDTPAVDTATTEDARKAKVAAAVARAKAKKAQQTETAHNADAPAADTATTEEARKAKVAAAVARAKAKKAQSKESHFVEEKPAEDKKKKAEAQPDDNVQEDKKARVAAAVEKAKAKARQRAQARQKEQGAEE
ncbi:electron transport complex subunit RsxC [Alteromonas sediminis]|uniref:Ion-translocating oxidoreductase complex subunit C n=1 Tax=Alteromonas sediminis TaxID=2259342 RepID=A0A3N5ZDW7_9ALTE|nr:electron transport complex subunit RsxC [Alteromonas sediminis]RPJ68428.1 electron transport complex subunit RsxC [Alteromonas sediminis]